MLYSLQAVALLAAAFTYNKYKHTAQKYFLLFIVYSVINDIVFFLLRIFTGERHFFHYNIYVFISFSFYLFWFTKILENTTSLKISKFLMVLVFVYSIIREDFFNKLSEFPLLIGILLVLIYVVQYFVELLKKNEVVNYLSSQEFWICTGILIFHLGYLPFIVLGKYTTNLEGKTIFITVLNMFMYGCFIKGFLCTRKK